jgi:hypothetical protein
MPDAGGRPERLYACLQRLLFWQKRACGRRCEMSAPQSGLRHRRGVFTSTAQKCSGDSYGSRCSLCSFPLLVSWPASRESRYRGTARTAQTRMVAWVAGFRTALDPGQNCTVVEPPCSCRCLSGLPILAAQSATKLYQRNENQEPARCHDPRIGPAARIEPRRQSKRGDRDQRESDAVVPASSLCLTPPRQTLVA